MAREHARIWLDINSDDDFEQLPFDAQGLYCRVIITLADLSYCGVADWRPARLTTKAPDLPAGRIISAAAHLELGRYCLFDLNTEEILVRSYIRRDELLRNPKFAGAVVKAYAGIASKTLRAAVVTEVRRIRDEHPEYSSWANKDVGPSLSKLMAKPGLDEVPYVNQITARMEPMTNGIRHLITNGITYSETVGITNGETVGITNPIGNGDSVPIPSTYTSTSTPAPLGGYVSREPHQGEPPPESKPPTQLCSRQPHGPDKPCRECRDISEANKQTAERRKAEDAKRRKAFWAEVENCPDCGPKGQVQDDTGPVAKCAEHDWSLIHAG